MDFYRKIKNPKIVIALKNFLPEIPGKRNGTRFRVCLHKKPAESTKLWAVRENVEGEMLASEMLTSRSLAVEKCYNFVYLFEEIEYWKCSNSLFTIVFSENDTFDNLSVGNLCVLVLLKRSFNHDIQRDKIFTCGHKIFL